MISRTALPSLLASFVLLVGVSQSVAQQLCKPTLTLKEARTSDARNQQRTWTPGLVVNASRCSTTSGSFEIQLTRLKEIAPDLRFTERFAWSSGQTEVSLDIWWDEWVQDYRIGQIAPCPCRN